MMRYERPEIIDSWHVERIPESGNFPGREYAPFFMESATVKNSDDSHLAVSV